MLRKNRFWSDRHFAFKYVFMYSMCTLSHALVVFYISEVAACVFLIIGLSVYEAECTLEEIEKDPRTERRAEAVLFVLIIL